MRILVTGGHGFIGRAVCTELARLGHEFIVLDRLAYRSDNNGLGVHQVWFGDVRDAVTVSEAVYHCDGVIHLAGVLGTQETIADPRPAAETNILGSLNVFSECIRRERRCVYIAVGNHWMLNPYSITKTAAEKFALMLNRERGARITVVRGLNAYGPGQKASPVRKIIPNFVMPALRDEEITVYGDGRQIMDMIFVADLARVLCAALLADHSVYDTPIEAGTGRETSVRFIAEEVIRQVGAGRLRFTDMRPGEPQLSRVVAGNSDLLAEIGIDPKTFLPLERGLAKTIEYYRAQMEAEVLR